MELKNLIEQRIKDKLYEARRPKEEIALEKAVLKRLEDIYDQASNIEKKAQESKNFEKVKKEFEKEFGFPWQGWGEFSEKELNTTGMKEFFEKHNIPFSKKAPDIIYNSHRDQAMSAIKSLVYRAKQDIKKKKTVDLERIEKALEGAMLKYESYTWNPELQKEMKKYKRSSNGDLSIVTGYLDKQAAIGVKKYMKRYAPYNNEYQG